MSKSKKTSPQTPEGLPPAAAKWFQDMLAEFAFEGDPGGLSLLEAAAWQLARMVQAREAIVKSGVTVQDRYGVPKESPAVAIERQASNAFRLLCRELGVSEGTDEAARIARGKK